MKAKEYLFALMMIMSYTGVCQVKNKGNQDFNKVKNDKSDFSVMPFINYNRNLDFMFGAIPMVRLSR